MANSSPKPWLVWQSPIMPQPFYNIHLCEQKKPQKWFVSLVIRGTSTGIQFQHHDCCKHLFWLEARSRSRYTLSGKVYLDLCATHWHQNMPRSRRLSYDLMEFCFVNISVIYNRKCVVFYFVWDLQIAENKEIIPKRISSNVALTFFAWMFLLGEK